MTELSWEMTLHWNFWHFDASKWKFLAKILRIWWYNFRCGTNENKGRTIWRFFFLSQLLQSTTHTDWQTYVGLALRQKKSLFKNGKNIFRTFWWPTFIFMWKLWHIFDQSWWIGVNKIYGVYREGFSLQKGCQP